MKKSAITKYRSQDLAKRSYHHLTTPNVPAVEGLTDDVKKGLEMVQESLVHAWKKKESKKFQRIGFNHNYHMVIQTLPADDEHPADTVAQVFQKAKLHDRILRPAMVVAYNPARELKNLVRKRH